MTHNFLMAFEPTDLIPMVVAFMGGGIITGISQYRKSKPEAQDVVVTSANKVVIMQEGLMENLAGEVQNYRKEVEVLRSFMHSLELRLDEVTNELSATRGQRDRLLRENGELKDENRNLRERVEGLQERVDRLEGTLPE